MLECWQSPSNRWLAWRKSPNSKENPRSHVHSQRLCLKWNASTIRPLHQNTEFQKLTHKFYGHANFLIHYFNNTLWFITTKLLLLISILTTTSWHKHPVITRVRWQFNKRSLRFSKYFLHQMFTQTNLYDLKYLLEVTSEINLRFLQLWALLQKLLKSQFSHWL